MSLTLFDKIWSAHLVLPREQGPSLLYIDRHIGRKVRRDEHQQDPSCLAHARDEVMPAIEQLQFGHHRPMSRALERGGGCVHVGRRRPRS